MNSGQNAQKMNLHQQSPAMALALCSPSNATQEMIMEDLARTPVSAAQPHPVQELQMAGQPKRAVGTAVDVGDDLSNDCRSANSTRRQSCGDMYKQIIKEASHALPRTPTGLARATPQVQPSESPEDASQESDPAGNTDTAPQQPLPQFGVGEGFRFGSDANPGVILDVWQPKGARAGSSQPKRRSEKRRSERPYEADRVGGSGEQSRSVSIDSAGGEAAACDNERLRQLERDLAREKALRAELQQKLLKSVEAAFFGPASDAVGDVFGANSSIDRATSGGQVEEETRGLLVHSKEVDLLRSQLETQDQVIDMLCKKIPCRDVIETLGGSALRVRGGQEAPHVMHSIVEESPSASSSSSPLPGALQQPAISITHSRVSGSSQAADERSLALGSGGPATEKSPFGSHRRDSLCREENAMALEHVHSSLQGANCSLDRALSATSATPVLGGTHTPSPDALKLVPRHSEGARAPSLSPDVSSLTTVVRLTREVQTLRQQHEGEQRLVERATAECTSLSTRCSKLEKEKSSLSASFQRLTDTLSQSIATGGEDAQGAPAMKALARLLEEARHELNELQEQDSLNQSANESALPALFPSAADTSGDQLEDEWDAPEDGDDDKGPLCASTAASKTACYPVGSDVLVPGAMDLTAEWYQSWYEPEGDTLATSFALLNISKDRRGHGDQDASVWSVQEVSPPRSARAATCSLSEADMTDEMGSQVLGDGEQGVFVAMSPTLVIGRAATAFCVALGRGLWVLWCLCLHLLSLSILVGGLTVSVHLP